MCYGVFHSFNRRLSLPPSNEYLYPLFPVVEEENIFIPELPRLMEDIVPDVVPAVVVPLLLPLGHGAGGIAPAQGPMPRTGHATRNAVLFRTLRAIGRSRN